MATESRKKALKKYNASDKHKNSWRRWYENGGAESTREYRDAHADEIDDYFREYRLKNAEKRREYSRQWYAANKAKAASAAKAYRPTRNARRKERLATDDEFYILSRLRERMCQAIRAGKARKNGRTEQLIGCPIPALKQHLESKFLLGMSWEVRDKIHIDHIRPCSSFDLTDPEQQKLCFNYTNLQPLWAADNLKKHAKWEEEKVA